MASSEAAASEFPLFALQPVADARHAWVGFVLAIAGEAAPRPLAPLFNDLGLAEALEPLSCIVPRRAVADPAALPARGIVLRCTADQLGEADALRQMGFRLLWDCPSGGAAPPEAAAALACDAAGELPAAAWLQQRPGPHLALAVDSRQRFEQCRALGFAWLAGDYPLAPASAALPGARSPNHGLLLKLLALVVRDADSREIEAALKGDARLSYQLLRLVNSAAMAPPRPITGFAEAIALLGRRQLQRWLQLLIYAHPLADGVNPLLPRAAFRARMMEVLCAQRGGAGEAQEQAFMVGMFSLLDVLFGQPLAELLAPLQLPDPVAAALRGGEGELGRLLAVVAVSQGGRAPAPADWPDAGPTAVEVARSLVEACRWSVRATREL